MKIEGINPKTGEIIESEAKRIDADFVDSMLEFSIEEDKLKSMIENLNISADAKGYLYSMVNATMKVGEFVIKVGRKIIEYVFMVLSEFPNATFGMIFAAIAGFLISSIPFVGALIGPLVTPILMVLGLTSGLIEDLQDRRLARKVAEVNAKFEAMNV